MATKTTIRVLCGIAGALLIVMAAALVVFGAAAAFGSYYDGPAIRFGIIPGPLFTIGRHLVARGIWDQTERHWAITTGDYLGDILVVMGLICALDGVWARDTEASDIAILLLFGGAAVYIASLLLARTLRGGRL